MTTARWQRAAASLFALVCAAPCVSAQAPHAGVEFTIVDPIVRAIVGGDLAQTETRLAQLMAARLDSTIGFVRFASGTQGNYGLRFTIDRQDPLATGDLGALGIRARLIHPDEDSTLYWITLRAAGEFTPIGSGEVLVREIADLVRTADYSLIDGLLAHVPISNEALPRATGWVLPLKAESLCLRDDTDLRVENRELHDQIRQIRGYAAVVNGFHDPEFPVPDERYRGGMFGAASGEIRSGDVVGVFVTRPERVRNCRLEPASPIAAGGAS